ncbi:MAG: hypothetical protein OXF88_07365, partial [Rhodobacteraceae bacterium]|nr:hypothetical protein [Paracoccaceae bacterium]
MSEPRRSARCAALELHEAAKERRKSRPVRDRTTRALTRAALLIRGGFHPVEESSEFLHFLLNPCVRLLFFNRESRSQANGKECFFQFGRLITRRDTLTRNFQKYILPR